MKKSPRAPAVLAVLFGFAGLCFIGFGPSRPEGGSSVLATTILLVTGVISLALADALWREHPHALRWYVAWVVIYLAGQASLQLLVRHWPISVVGLWLLFIGSVYVALGVYLRGRLRRAA